MDEKTALHTAARSYCYHRAPGLDPQQQERWYRDRRWTRDRVLRQAMLAAGGTPAQLALMREILVQIEQVTPDDFSSTEALRTFLIEMGQQAGEMLPAPDPDFEHAAAQERARFCASIESLSAEQLSAAHPVVRDRLILRVRRCRNPACERYHHSFRLEEASTL